MPEILNFAGVIFFIIGLCFGSFATLMSYRLPRDMPVLLTHSKCPKCHKNLGFIDLIPLFSWVLFKAKCRKCGKKISARYPLIEITCGIIFLLIYLKFGLSFISIILCLISVALLIITVVDLEHKIIPDSMQIALIILAVFYHAAAFYENGTINLPEIFGGCVFGITVSLLIRYIFFKLKGIDSLGLGDVKFFAVSGLFIGFSGMSFYLMLSGLLGSAFGICWKIFKKEKLFPFGPALVAALATLLYFPELPAQLERYISIIYLNI